MEKAEKKGIKIHLPTDFITADKFDKDATVREYIHLHLIFHLSLSLTPSIPSSLLGWQSYPRHWHS